MLKPFYGYKKIIENNLLSLSYLYSGDVISSINSSYKEELPIDSTLPKKFIKWRFIINSLDSMRKWSIENMINNTNMEIISVLDFEKLDMNGLWLEDLVNNLNIESFTPKFIFINSTKYLGIVKDNGGRPLPEYFYQQGVRKSKDLEIYKISIIDEIDEQIVIYITDKPIQSLVYVLQNMEYTVSDNIHKMTYNLYNCDYRCYKITVKNIIKMRDDKISQLLS
jgi:hypothetical protein